MPAEKKIFNLHIGMPKTGTTSLQSHVFPNHSEIDFLGTYISDRRKRPLQCRDEEVRRFMHELLWDNMRTPDFALCQNLFNQWKEAAGRAGKILLWSWESLMENTHDVQYKRAENIRRVVGEANIIVCLRHPVSLMESLYVQLLKRDNIGAYAKQGKPHRFETVEQWLKKGWNLDGHPPKAHLEYPESLQIFADVFGKDAVRVFLFEQLVENQPAYIRDLCEFLGINPDEGIRLAEVPPVNERWGQQQYDELKRLNTAPLRALRFRFSNKKQRASMLGMTNHPSGRTGSKTHIHIPPEWKEKIEEKTREGNRSIQQQWQVPLEKYRYPL